MITIIEKFKINKMNKEQLEEHLILYFDKMSPKLKEVSILKYGEFILKENEIENYKIEVKELENPNINGHCYPKIRNFQDSEKIILNKSYINSKKIFDIIATIYHECKHAIQNNILESSKNNNLYHNEYAKSLDYCKNKISIDINFCNFNLKDVSLHIKFNNILSMESSLFYHLNISEREAFLEEQQCIVLQKKYQQKGQYNYNIQQDITFFNLYYHCNLSNEKVFDIIDKCYENLVENKLPSHNEEGNLIATVMYDMCLVVGYNSGVLSKEEVLKLSTLKEKQKNLAKEDFIVYGTTYDGNLFSNEKQEQIVKNPKLLKNLTKIEQNANCFLIWRIIYNNKDSPPEFFNELLKDKETFFKQIVENEFSRDMCSELLAKIFENDFIKHLNQHTYMEENKDDK